MRTRGVTLIEIMVVVAIIGIISSLAVATTENLRARTAPRNAAADFSTVLSQARARATERGSDVWVIIYPNRGEGSAAGNGAWFLYEDPDLDFGKTGSATCDGSVGSTCNFAAFNPPNLIHPPPASPTTFDRLLEKEYLDRAAKKNVTFGNAANTALLFGPPFASSATTGLNASTVKKDCSFCTGTGLARRGAIVFNGDGAARFVDGSGLPSWEPMAALSLQGVDASAKQVTLFGISATTGYVGVFK